MKCIKSIAYFFILFSLSYSIKAFSQKPNSSNLKKYNTDTAKINSEISFYKRNYFNYEDSAIKSIKILKDIFNKSKKINYSKGIIESSFYLGNCYTMLSKPNEAIKYYYISLKNAEYHKNIIGIARAKMGIGLVYYSQNNYQNSIEFFIGSLRINLKQKEISRSSTQFYLIGLSLNSLKKYDEAKSYLDSAIAIKEKIKDFKGINECMMGIADNFKGINQIDTALKLYNYLLKQFILQNESVPISLIYSSLAEIYLNKNEINTALKYSNESIKYSEIVKSYLPKLKAYEINNKILLKKNDYKNAFSSYLKYQLIKDSIQNKDFISQISIANAKYHFEKEQTALKAQQQKQKYEHEIEIKNKNRRQLLLIAILSVLFIIALIILISYRGVNIQKKISESLLLNILPLETTLELKKYGRSIPKIHNGATIMFCDVKNFSTIAEKLSPEQIVEMLDTYFKQFDKIIGQRDIEKIKTIGDAYMCVGGLHGKTSKAVIDIVNSSIEFLKFSIQIEKSMLEKYGHAFYFRVGIHTGNVISGVVGETKYSYDIWGDDVNIAARMEQNSKPGNINISESTYNLIKNDFDCTSRGKIPIKNRGAIAMYFVNIDNLLINNSN